MPVGTLLWVVLAAIAASIALSYKLKVNLGIPALIFAYIIGCFILKMRVKEIVALWPTSTVFLLMTITMFFSFAVFNGTLPKVASKILYASRNNIWALPFLLLLVGVIIGGLGAPPPAVNAILAVICFTIAIPAGMSPMLMAIVVVYGGASGTFFPWAVQGSIAKGIMGGFVGDLADGYTWKIFLAWLMFTVICFAIVYIATKGHKLKKIDIEKPEPFDKIQKKNLIIIIIVAILIIIPPLFKIMLPKSASIAFLASTLDVQMLAVIGVFVCTVMKLGDEKQAIVKGVPWSTILMLGGVCTLMGVATSAGVTDYIAQWIGSSIPVTLIVPVFTILAAFLSLFSGALTVVFPMLSAMAMPIAVAAGIAPAALFIGIIIGGSATAISPFSTGGATMIANCPDQSQHVKLFNVCLLAAGMGAVISLAMSFIGLFSL